MKNFYTEEKDDSFGRIIAVRKILSWQVLRSHWRCSCICWYRFRWGKQNTRQAVQSTPFERLGIYTSGLPWNQQTKWHWVAWKNAPNREWIHWPLQYSWPSVLLVLCEQKHLGTLEYVVLFAKLLGAIKGNAEPNWNAYEETLQQEIRWVRQHFWTWKGLWNRICAEAQNKND